MKAASRYPTSFNRSNY